MLQCSVDCDGDHGAALARWRKMLQCHVNRRGDHGTATRIPRRPSTVNVATEGSRPGMQWSTARVVEAVVGLQWSVTEAAMELHRASGLQWSTAGVVEAVVGLQWCLTGASSVLR